ncbi:acylneuraminate cytidylyltransferase family protein [Sediminispirochaeta bajacaliforniensis]|uniref:acylneuraminate cytidylyltransferase family protein n=1 Tax=Sediminispirochaeta bajacaliforniensis TaxID=148 RepID=UPI00036B5FC1|nr:hypothetical protein [Sediminispirochaeta bajacaliforniensis]
MKVIAMIPARMGSQRLKQKNLREIDGIPIITHAIRKSKSLPKVNEVWVNSEHDTFGEIAKQEDVNFYKRPSELANNTATSEDFVFDFLRGHNCDILLQVHSIAPLLRKETIERFLNAMIEGGYDSFFSVVNEQIECAMNDKPLNFSFSTKTNSQELTPIQRITWSITGWRRETFLEAYNAGGCATYSGTCGFFPLDREEGIIIKTEKDFQIAKALYKHLD